MGSGEALTPPQEEGGAKSPLTSTVESINMREGSLSLHMEKFAVARLYVARNFFLLLQWGKVKQCDECVIAQNISLRVCLGHHKLSLCNLKDSPRITRHLTCPTTKAK